MCICVGQAGGDGTVCLCVREGEWEEEKRECWCVISPLSNCGAWEALLSRSNYYKWFMWPVKRVCQGSYFISRKRSSAGRLSGSPGLNWQLQLKSCSSGWWQLVSRASQNLSRQRPARKELQGKGNISKWGRFLSLALYLSWKDVLLAADFRRQHGSYRIGILFLFSQHRRNHSTKPLSSVPVPV